MPWARAIAESGSVIVRSCRSSGFVQNLPCPGIHPVPASGTRAIATKLWKGRLPNRPPEQLVRELYEAENKGKSAPSGSQDLILSIANITSPAVKVPVN